MLAGFILCTALDLNGSSTPIWSVLFDDARTVDALLLFKPRESRSDEWLVWTPSILAQANHQPAYPVENPAVGAGKSPLIMSLPVWHYSMLFRPQLYGFFLLGTERGFAWYWNTKVFGLLAAMFLLFLRLTRGRTGLALCGAALLFASSYVQWFFSCPPMLPEMLSMWALAIVCIITLCERCSVLMRGGAIVGLVIGIINFALCCYPPFQIPLVYLAAAILCGWFWQSRGPDRNSAPRRTVVVSFAAAALCSCGVLIPFFIECLPTLHMVANTAYPGARRCNGGGISFDSLLRGIAAPLVFEDTFPEKLDNVCEASSFFPIALAAVPLILVSLRGQWKNLKLILPSCLFLGFFTLFSLVPMPHWLAAATGLSVTTTVRWVLVIGMANIVIAILFLPEAAKAPLKLRGLAWLVAMVLTGCWFVAASRTSPIFLTGWRIAALAVASAMLYASYLTGRARLFGLCSLCVLGPAALTVNPVTQGLGPLLRSPGSAAVREIARSDPGAGWAAYNTAVLSQFLVAQGLPVVTGAKTLPDLRFYDQIDPGGRSRDIYNRYGISVFRMPSTAAGVHFNLLNFCGFFVSISPLNPALHRAGVRFFVFPQAVHLPGLQLLKSLPDSHLWIYRNLAKTG